MVVLVVEASIAFAQDWVGFEGGVCSRAGGAAEREEEETRALLRKIGEQPAEPTNIQEKKKKNHVQSF